MSDLSGPRQVVLVSSRATTEVMGKSSEKDNIITIAWHMPVSFDPLMYAIAVGKTRHSCSLIKEGKCFVVNFMPYALADAAMICGTTSGISTNKYQKANLKMEEAESVDCGRIKEAVAYAECEVVNEVEAGDHIVFIGEVVNSKVKDIQKRLFQGLKRDFTTTKD